MKAILHTVLVSTFLVAAAVRPVGAQQLDPAVLEAIVARLNLTDTQLVVARPVLEAGILERQQILKDAGFESGKKTDSSPTPAGSRSAPGISCPDRIRAQWHTVTRTDACVSGDRRGAAPEDQSGASMIFGGYHDDCDVTGYGR